jgi:hypothetical protein
MHFVKNSDDWTSNYELASEYDYYWDQFFAGAGDD